MANWATKELLGDPSTPEWQKRYLRSIEPIPGQKWNVYGEAAPAFTGFLSDLAKTGYRVRSSGGFNYRNIRGSDTLSQHAFGTAIDLNAEANPLGGHSNLPPQTAALANKWGLEWGGNWKGRPDPMHFEYRGPNASGTTSGGPQAAGDTSLMSQAQPDQGASSGLDIFGDSRRNMSQGDWLKDTNYSSDALISDFFGGRNPLKRMVFQKAASIFDDSPMAMKLMGMML